MVSRGAGLLNRPGHVVELVGGRRVELDVNDGSGRRPRSAFRNRDEGAWFPVPDTPTVIKLRDFQHFVGRARRAEV